MKLTKLLCMIAFLLCVCICAAGCTGTSNNNVGEIDAQNSNSNTITDDTGVVVTIPANAKRIVSLAPSITELYYALTDENSTAKLVGRTDFCTYPSQALSVDSVGGMTAGTSIESVISKNPDIILSTTMVDSTLIEQLRQNDYPVIVSQIDTVEDIFRNIKLLGKVLQEPDNAEMLINTLNASLSKIEAKTTDKVHPKTMYVVSTDPMYAAGNATYLDQLIRIAGGENVYSDVNGYFIASTESIIQRQPEVIIVIEGEMNLGIDLKKQILENKELAKIPAVINQRVYTVDDNIVSRPGPRIVEAAEILYKCINENEQ